MKRVLGIMLLPSLVFAKSAVVCESSKSLSEATNLLNGKINQKEIIYEQRVASKVQEKIVNEAGILFSPKSFSGLAVVFDTEKYTVCIAVSE